MSFADYSADFCDLLDYLILPYSHKKSAINDERVVAEDSAAAFSDYVGGKLETERGSGSSRM